MCVRISPCPLFDDAKLVKIFNIRKPTIVLYGGRYRIFCPSDPGEKFDG